MIWDSKADATSSGEWSGGSELVMDGKGLLRRGLSIVAERRQARVASLDLKQHL